MKSLRYSITGLFAIALPMLTTPALGFAAPAEQILYVTNNRDAGTSRLSITLGITGAVAALDYVTDPHDGSAIIRKHFDAGALARGRGVILEADMGYTGLLLRGRFDERAGSANLVLRYLHNGLTNEYKECALKLTRTSGRWSAFNAYTGKAITEMRIATWSLGIWTLEGICPGTS